MQLFRCDDTLSSRPVASREATVMSDNVSVEAAKQLATGGNGRASPVVSEASAATQQDLAWQQVMQAYYKQQQQQQQQQPHGQQTAFYPAAAHPYAGFFAGQPLMYGAPFYGGIVPYAYPAPAAAGVPGSEGTTNVDKPVVAQPLPAGSFPKASGSAALPPRGGQGSHAQRVTLHSKASSNSLNGLSESGQFAKQSSASTPPASPVQTPVAEQAKEKTLHASDSEGIRAEGQAAAMAAIAAAQAQANGRAHDESRANSGEYWVRSNSEEDMERADSGGLQDEREVKRQRRKQSNRESARRSRLRKQAECEALAVRVNELINENVKLRAANEQLLKLQHLSSHQVNDVGKS